MRIEKVSEVIGKYDAYEYFLDCAFKQAQEAVLTEIVRVVGEVGAIAVAFAAGGVALPPPSAPLYQEINKRLDEILQEQQKLHTDFESALHKNRFWLGEEVYLQIYSYLAGVRDSESKLREARDTLRNLAQTPGSHKTVLPALKALEKGIALEIERRKKRRIDYVTIRNKLLKE
jgi:hypothetical protein